MKVIKHLFLLLYLVLTYLTLFAQDTDVVVDERDNNIYLVKKFGNTWWTCQNLNFNAGNGSYCYDDDEMNCMLKGKLYTYEAAMKACPPGYSLPADDDWKALEKMLGMDEKELELKYNRNSAKVGKQLIVGGESGFEAEYGGVKNPQGNDMYFDMQAYFWTSTPWDEGNAWSRVLYQQREGVDRKVVPKTYGLSVRCIKKATGETE